jgi:hypothetical protein
MNGTIVPGQYGLAAVDGANSTVWQPGTSNASSIMIDLGSERSFKKLHLNWGDNPASSYAVSAGNSTDNLTSIISGNPTISVPYDASTAAQVRLVVGNTTDVTLNETVSARYVSVSISGSSLGDGRGATLAEFAVIAA